jgi:hypothetical protein
MTKQKRTRSLFHVSSHGRRVAKHDEELFRLIEFANILTPRGGTRDSLERRISTLWGNFLDSMIGYGYEAAGELEGSYEQRTEPLSGKTLDQMCAIYAEAPRQFPHPTIPLAIAIPGINPPIECSSPDDLACKALIVRTILWSAAVSFDRRVSEWGQKPLRLRLPPPTVLVRKGHLEVVENIGGGLLELLMRLDKPKKKGNPVSALERLHICDVRYTRTKSNCRRLFLALRHDQKACSPECADQLRHNEKRHKVQRPGCF